MPQYAGSVIHSGERDILDKVQIRMIKMIHGIRGSYRNKLRKSGMTTKRPEIFMVLEYDSKEYSADSAAYFLAQA